MAIKVYMGKLSLPDNLENFISEQLAINAIYTLPVPMSHALHVYALPNHRRDPFDRMLVAQAQLESMPILASDTQIVQYPVKTIW
jgi:PIN domain nuclease of toxin-antitoxin system